MSPRQFVRAIFYLLCVGMRHKNVKIRKKLLTKILSLL